MADEVKYQSPETKVEEPCDAPAASAKVVEPAPVETSDRGFFGFGKKKEEEKKSEEEVIASEFDEKVQVSCEEEEKKEETKHETILQKLQRSGSSSSSSSSDEEEEIDENGEKKKKKKGLKEKIKGEEKEKPADIKYEDTSVPVEKCDDVATHEPEAEKKGLLDKIKDKLPGGKKAEEVDAPPPASEYHAAEPEAEKKGFLEKIKEKIPGYHPKTVEEKEKIKEKEGAC